MQVIMNNLTEDEAIQLSYDMQSISQVNGPCKISFDNNMTCTPFGMLLSANVLGNFVKAHPQMPLQYMANENDNGISYAGHMGFFKTISYDCPIGKAPGEALGSNTYVPISRISLKMNNTSNLLYANMPYTQTIELEADRLARVLGAQNVDLYYLFKYIIVEILRNSWEHGDVKEVWICAQNWYNKGQAEIAIMDNGNGYYKSLKRKYPDLINDEDAISASLQPGITETYIPPNAYEEENSGFGLYVISEICNALNGSLTILSGKKAVISRNNNILVKDGYHNGSIIKIRINTMQDFNYKNLLGKIIAKGSKIIQERGENILPSRLSRGEFLIK